MVAGTLELLLQQARSAGVGVILVNQTAGDLKQGSIDFTHTVEGNTAIQAWFKTSDRAGLEQLERLGGKTVDTLTSVSHTDGPNGSSRTVTKKEVLINRFESSDTTAAASEANAFILRITEDLGYAQYGGIPFVAKWNYHLTEAEYDRRVNAPWPQRTGGTLIVGDNNPPALGVGGQTPRPTGPKKPSPVMRIGTLGRTVTRKRPRP
jgi:hypothetical protein